MGGRRRAQRAAGTPARAGAGRGARPSPVALITFVLVLREGETLRGPCGRWGWGWRVREGSGRDCLEMGEGGARNGDERDREGRAVSFGSEADQ